MNKSLLSFSLLLFVACQGQNITHTNAATQAPQEKDQVQVKVIYGDDDRKNLYEVADPQWRTLADSTVALIERTELQMLGGGKTKVKAVKFADAFNLCASEPFREEPTGAFCSGTLVGPDLILTAGHCVRTQDACDRTAFVFGYHIERQGDTAENVLTDDVYLCRNLEFQTENGQGADFALVKLDRKVNNRSPLQIRRSGEPQVGDDMVVIGHPSGLPTKVAGGAKVRNASTNGFFVANLDTYGGNSGSAVFSAKTGLIEGVLVRGEQDFVYNGSCAVSKVCAADSCRGEDVTRISEARGKIPKMKLKRSRK